MSLDRYLLVDIVLNPIEFGRVLASLDVVDVEEVIPEVVVHLDMLLKVSALVDLGTNEVEVELGLTSNRL